MQPFNQQLARPRSRLITLRTPLPRLAQRNLGRCRLNRGLCHGVRSLAGSRAASVFAAPGGPLISSMQRYDLAFATLDDRAYKLGPSPQRDRLLGAIGAQVV